MKKEITREENKQLWEEMLKNNTTQNIKKFNEYYTFISDIKKQMMDWYGIDLLDQQISDYVKNTGIKYFDTLEREDFLDCIAKEITGMSYPMNKDTEEYKKQFFDKFDGVNIAFSICFKNLKNK